jgi:hypothetical protein
MPGTNLVRSGTALGNIQISHAGHQIRGTKAVFGNREGVEELEIQGEPVANIRASQGGKTNEFRIHADSFVWDPKAGKYKARGRFKIQPQGQGQLSKIQ